MDIATVSSHLWVIAPEYGESRIRKQEKLKILNREFYMFESQNDTLRGATGPNFDFQVVLDVGNTNIKFVCWYHFFRSRQINYKRAEK